jgi:Flp pilus assembly protein TadG
MMYRGISQEENFIMGNKFHFPFHFRSARAQGMVEFALALPVFLLLMFGVIEFGRFLMTFNAVFTAAREAARYGAAVGLNNDGKRFDHDCPGMKAAAVRVGFLGGVTENQVWISLLTPDPINPQNPPVVKYDDWCTQVQNDPKTATNLNDMIRVIVATNYSVIMPLVPIPKLEVSGSGSASTGGIRSTSTRSLIQNVALEGVTIPLATPQKYKLTIKKVGNGSSPTVGESYYLYGETVTLTAVPDTCWKFTGWTDDMPVLTEEIHIPMTRDWTVTANFEEKKYNLTVNTTTDPFVFGVIGGEVKIDNNTYSTVNGQFSEDLSCGSHTLNAVPTKRPTTATDYFFYNWSGSAVGANNPILLNLDDNKTILASFTTPDQPYKLTANLNIPGSGTITNDKPTAQVFPGTYNYLPGTGKVTLSAQPKNLDYGFINWTDDTNQVIGIDPNKLEVTMNGNKTIIANFGSALKVVPAGCVLDNVDSGCLATITSPTGQYFSPGTPIKVTATPAPGWSFVNWTSSGAIPSSTTNPYSFAFPSSGTETLTANFKRTVYNLKLSVNPLGLDTVAYSLAAPYYYQNMVSVTPESATMEPGYRFKNWDYIGTSPASDPTKPSITIGPIVDNMDLTLNLEAYCAPEGKIYLSDVAYSNGNKVAKWLITNLSGLDIEITSLTVSWIGSGVSLNDVAINNTPAMWVSDKKLNYFTPQNLNSLASNNIVKHSSVANSLVMSFDGAISGAQLTPNYSKICGK